MNSVNGEYDPEKADHKAYRRRKYARYQEMKIMKHAGLREYIGKLLLEGHSPEAVSGRLKNVDTHMEYVSGNSIRTYICSVYGRDIEYELKKMKRKKRRKIRRREPDMTKVPIGNRPRYINSRERFGDCEADFIASGKGDAGLMLVLVERKTRKIFMEGIPNPSIPAVHDAFMKIKRSFPHIRSVTLDNDILFRRHGELAELLGADIYFCDPYSSWQKGAVENANRNIREYIPKKTGLSKYTEPEVRNIETKLNGRIMKSLDYRTPEEMFAMEMKREKKRRKKNGKNGMKK